MVTSRSNRAGAARQDLHALLDHLMRRTTLSSRELAARAQVPVSRLAEVIEGWQPPTKIELDRLLRAFQASPGMVQECRSLLTRILHFPQGRASLGSQDKPQDLYRLREDVPGHDLKPDPLNASCKEEFLALMREFQVWAGEPSYREIVLTAGKTVGASTLCEALDVNKIPRLPSLKVVTAFIHGCGGSEEDLIRWTTAWRQIRMARTSSSKVTVLPTADQRCIS